MCFASLTMAIGMVYASRKLHFEMLKNVIHLPMSFFDVTPLGRIVSRFGKVTFFSAICVVRFTRHLQLQLTLLTFRRVTWSEKLIFERASIELHEHNSLRTSTVAIFMTLYLFCISGLYAKWMIGNYSGWERDSSTWFMQICAVLWMCKAILNWDSTVICLSPIALYAYQIFCIIENLAVVVIYLPNSLPNRTVLRVACCKEFIETGGTLRIILNYSKS